MGRSYLRAESEASLETEIDVRSADWGMESVNSVVPVTSSVEAKVDYMLTNSTKSASYYDRSVQSSVNILPDRLGQQSHLSVS